MSDNQELINQMNGEGIGVAFVLVVIFAAVAICYREREQLREWYKKNLEQSIFQALIFLRPEDNKYCEHPVNRVGSDKWGKFCMECGIRL